MYNTDSIERSLVDGFEKRLFQAALDNLEDANNPLRFNNFAYACRELIRHVLQRLAPDEEVRACTWYAEETGQRDGVSRRQRACYAVQGGLTDDYLSKVLALDVSDIHRSLVAAINNLSKYTHIEESTFNLSPTEVESHAQQTLVAVDEFFEVVVECRSRLGEALRQHLHNSVFSAAISETIVSVDILATHHTVEYVWVDEVDVVGISSRRIDFRVFGNIEVLLQYGSGSDFARGDGAEIPESFPYSCTLMSAVSDPGAVETSADCLEVDTNSWFV